PVELQPQQPLRARRDALRRPDRRAPRQPAGALPLGRLLPDPPRRRVPARGLRRAHPDPRALAERPVPGALDAGVPYAPAPMEPARAIENLLGEYCERIDLGDFDGVGALFAEGALADEHGAELARGAEAVAAFYRA